MVCFDYTARKVAPMSDDLKGFLEGGRGGA